MIRNCYDLLEIFKRVLKEEFMSDLHVTGLENIETVRRGGDDNTWQLRMPHSLLDVILTHVQEQQLRGVMVGAFWDVVILRVTF